MEFEKEMPESNMRLFATHVCNREIFKISPSGDIYVNGKIIENDNDVVKALGQVLQPEINKNNLYDEMLEMLKEMKEAIEWYQDNCSPIEKTRNNDEIFFNLGTNLRQLAEELIIKATTI